MGFEGTDGVRLPGRRRGARHAGGRSWAVPVVSLLLLLALVALAGCGGDGSVGGSGSGATEAAGSTDGSPAAAGQAGASAAATPQPTDSPEGAASGASGAGKGSGTKVVFVDVGQGDASVVRSGAWAGLIDGGPSGSEAAVGRALARLKVRRLNAVVVSHMHQDHTGGLPGVVRRFRPRVAYVAGPVDEDLQRAFAAAGTRVVQVRRGRSLPAWGSARAQVLSPAGLSADGDENEDSIVLLLRASGRRFLFTGDSTGAGEEAAGEICARGPPVTVLKVSHHGSEYSTSSAFLTGVRPRFAVISVGPNDYGHPTPETLARLRETGATVYTTWKNGTVTFTVAKGGALGRTFSRSSTPVRSVRDARGR